MYRRKQTIISPRGSHPRIFPNVELNEEPNQHFSIPVGQRTPISIAQVISCRIDWHRLPTKGLAGQGCGGVDR